MKNLCGKMRKKDNPYEIWSDGSWTWYVLKKWQADDDAPYARWFCLVVTPMTGPRGDLGDCYVAEIKRQARRIDVERPGQQGGRDRTPPPTGRVRRDPEQLAMLRDHFGADPALFDEVQ